MLNDHVLTDEETRTLKKKASDILSVCRRDILTKYPFIGSIALRMEMVPVRDVRVRTACTDGNAVYFDIAFLSSLTREEQTFVLAHEVWHAVMMHLVRRQNRIPSLFNIATDKEVNALLKKDGFTPPKDLLFPTHEEEGKCAEEIYEMLLKKQKQQMQQTAGGTGNSGSGSSSQSNSSSKSKNGKQNNNQRGGSSNTNQPNQNPGGGNEDGELKGQFDKHIYDGMEDGQGSNGNQPSNSSGSGSGNEDGESEGEGSENGNGSGSQYGKITDKYGQVGFDSDYQPKVSKDFADKMRETIVSEAQRCEKMKGNLPSHIKELVKKCMTPEIKWQEVLAQFVTRCYNSGNRSWIPPNRRHVHNGIYLQSRQASKIKLAVGIDTSGSTYGDRSKFLGELHSLIKSFGLFDLHIIECDAEVGAYKHYTQDDNLEFEIDNGEYTMSGGGGTAMRPIYDYILDNQIECDAVIIMTDGYIDHIPNNPIPSLPTLWIITKDGTDDFCDWGQKIKLKTTDSDFE